MREPFFSTRSRRDIAADNRAELAAWIDERAADLVAAGVSPVEARRRAVEEFGDVQAAERYAARQDVAADRRVRALLWLEELTGDLRIAARTLARTPAVTAVVLLTFALGIGATTAVFSVVHAMLLRPLPYGAEETLAQLRPVENGVTRPAARHSAAALAALRAQTTSFSGIAGVSTVTVVMTGRGDPEMVNGSVFTPDAFDVLRAPAAIGRTFNLADDLASPLVVLLDGLWRRRFAADPRIVGQTIDMSGRAYQVIGVMPAGFRVPTYEHAEYVIPQDISNLLRNPNNAQVRVFRLFARLKPGVAQETAQADVDRTLRTLQNDFPTSFAGIEAELVPIRTGVAGDARVRLLVLMGAAGFVLLIACANVAGILFSRALARRHELSVRVALGAGRQRLIRQFMAEGAVLAVAGGALGLVAAHLAIGLLRPLASAALPPGTTFALERSVLLFAIAAAAIAAFTSSLVPALGATRATGSALRRDEGRATPSRASRRLRIGLVAAQLGVAVVLLVGAGLFMKTLHRLAALDLGYSTDRALTFRLPFIQAKYSSDAQQDVFWASLYDRVRTLPGVVSVGGGGLPLTGQSSLAGVEIEHRRVDGSRLPEARYSVASDDYFTTLGIPLLRGRTFTADDRNGVPWVAVVSASFARQQWPNGDPIGTRIKTEPQKPWATIVGIVGDVRMGGGDAALPSVYTSQRQDHWPGGGTVMVRVSGDMDAVIAGIRQAVKELDPYMPIAALRTLDEFRRNTPALAERRMQMQLMLGFALVALAVSAIGVYGVSAYATEARRREFGIRLALGASRRRVLRLALRDGAVAAVFGMAVGLPVAWLLASRLRDLLFAVPPFDPATMVVVVGSLIAVVFAAAIVPARRATLVDPAHTMRTD